MRSRKFKAIAEILETERQLNLSIQLKENITESELKLLVKDIETMLEKFAEKREVAE